MKMRHTKSGEGKKHRKCFCLQLHFSAKVLFSQIYGLNAQNCKIHIPKRASILQNIRLVLVLDHETCALSNAVGFFTKL